VPGTTLAIRTLEALAFRTQPWEPREGSQLENWLVRYLFRAVGHV
jgi:hypothetical protein